MKSYRVAHILLTHKYEAEDLLKKLKEGKSFSELALKNSICSSSQMAGDLGTLILGKADADFEEAALSLQIGETSKIPVKTRFGYHLIKRLA